MAISVGLVSVAVGIGIPVFYETQIDNAVTVFLPLLLISNPILFYFVKLRVISVAAGKAR